MGKNNETEISNNLNTVKATSIKITFLLSILLVIFLFLTEVLLKQFEFRYILLLVLLPSIFFIVHYILRSYTQQIIQKAEENMYTSETTQESNDKVMDVSEFKNEIKSKIEENLNYNTEIDEVVNNKLMMSFLNQAQDTESAIAAATDYIDSLNSLVEKEEEITNKLTKAIELLNECNSKLDDSCKEISNISEQFLTLKNKSSHLQEGSNDILQLIESIKGVIKKTQLLSFNASIEAARAGESGKSFTIVADEIKALSEKTKSSVENINTNLEDFTTTLNSVSDNIDQQYEAIKERLSNFDDMAVTAHENINKVKQISDSLFEVKDEILEQVDRGKKIRDKISNLSQSSNTMLDISGNITEKVNQQKEQLQEILNTVDNIDKEANS